jgi:hypothetical protein
MTENEEVLQYPWDRFWVPQGQNPTMAEGYFVEPSSSPIRWLHPESNGVPLSALRDVPCLVLLGDMGMGKSTTVQQEYQSLSRSFSGQRHEVVLRDLKRLTEEQIYRQVFGHPAVEGWRRGDHALTLFLDSMDECWRRLDELETILVGEFERSLRDKKPRLFLRVTCRSAEWRSHVGEAFKRLFPGEHDGGVAVQIYTLAPLSEANIRQAAEFHKQDANDLVRRVAENQVQALAAHPITFKMLLGIYAKGGSFPDSRVDLYARGCQELCTDLHSVFGSTSQRVTTREQRFAIASRFAALSVLTNRYLINGNTDNPLGRLDVLEASDLFGYYDEQAGGQQVAIDRATATDTLQTALFGEPADGAQNWRHQSYAEFLAARYLANSKLSSEQITSLITDTTDNAQGLIPQLEETACWLVEMKPGLFEALAPSNAEVFIRCDPKQLDDPKREMLVDNYLGLVRKHEAPELDWQLKHQLGRLAHGGLAAQLGKAIRNRRENPLVLESAIDIAAYCRCGAVAPQLIEVFADRDDVFRVRQRAGFALEQIADERIRSMLKRRTVVENLEDNMDELKGFCLKVLWPSQLSTSELLPLLTPPKRQNHTGSYKLFLFELQKKLPDSELPQVLDWMREKEISFDTLGSFGHFPSDVATRALQKLDDPEVRRALMALIQGPEHRLRHLFQSGRERLSLSTHCRRTFWSAVVSEGIEPRTLIILGNLPQTGLLNTEDLPFFIERYRSSTEKQRKHWEQMIFSVFDEKHPDALEQLSGLASLDCHIAEILAALTSCPLIPEEINWRKKQFQRHKTQAEETATKPKPSAIIERMDEGLRRFDQGEILGFCWVLELLDTDPEEPTRFGSLNVRLSEGKVWPLLSPDLKTRILLSASRYLDDQPFGELNAWDEEKNYRVYLAADPLFLLLFDEAKETLSGLTSEQLKKWIPVLFAYHDRHNGNHDEAYDFIFTLAFRKAPDESLAVLKRFLELHVNHDSKRKLIWRLGPAWCPEIEEVFRSLIRQKPLRPTAAGDVFQLLCAHDPVGTRDLLEQILEERKREDACSVFTPVAGMVLLTSFPETWGPRTMELFNQDPPLGRSIAWSLLRGISRPPDWISRLPPKTNATLWDWLEVQFPGDPYDTDDGSGSVTAAHEMCDFRRGVFQSLVQRTSREACDALKWLMELRPQAFWLGDFVARMKKAVRGAVWNRPSPSALMKSFKETERRLIRTAGDLQRLLLESLARFEQALHGSPPSMELWNEVAIARRRIWDPKDEMNVSNRLKLHFERDLAQFGIVGDREVTIRPRLGDDPAQLVDILVHATPFGEDGKPGKVVSVVVEVKCSWNRGVLHDMERQLKVRYLATSRFDFGIYVVAYFSCEAWNRTKDSRRRTGVNRLKIAAVASRLLKQAKMLSSTEKRIEAFVLDARFAEHKRSLKPKHKVGSKFPAAGKSVGKRTRR